MTVLLNRASNGQLFPYSGQYHATTGQASYSIERPYITAGAAQRLSELPKRSNHVCFTIYTSSNRLSESYGLITNGAYREHAIAQNVDDAYTPKIRLSHVSRPGVQSPAGPVPAAEGSIMPRGIFDSFFPHLRDTILNHNGSFANYLGYRAVDNILELAGGAVQAIGDFIAEDVLGDLRDFQSQPKGGQFQRNAVNSTQTYLVVHLEGESLVPVQPVAGGNPIWTVEVDLSPLAEPLGAIANSTANIDSHLERMSQAMKRIADDLTGPDIQRQNEKGQFLQFVGKLFDLFGGAIGAGKTAGDALRAVVDAIETIDDLNSVIQSVKDIVGLFSQMADIVKTNDFNKKTPDLNSDEETIADILQDLVDKDCCDSSFDSSALVPVLDKYFMAPQYGGVEHNLTDYSRLIQTIEIIEEI